MNILFINPRVKDEVTSAIPDMYAFSYLMHSNALSKVIRGYYPHNYKSNEVGCLSDFAILEVSFEIWN